MKRTLLLIASAFMTTFNFAQQGIPVTLGATTYSQDFNTLATSGTSSALPTAWGIYEQGIDTFADGQYISDITLTTPGVYSLGDDASLGLPYVPSPDASDRALGSRSSSTYVPITRYGVKITNAETADTAITSFVLSYKGETWFQPANQFDTLRFYYSVDADSVGDTTSVTWVPVPSLDYVMQDTFDMDNALYYWYAGNIDGNSETITGSVTTGLNVPKGSSFYIMWQPSLHTGVTSSLGGIDDVSIEFGFGAQVIDTTDTTDTIPGSVAMTPRYNTLEATMYPTPASEDIKIKISSSLEAVNWYMANSIGQRVKTGVIAAPGYGSATVTVDVRDLPAGIYFIYLQTADDDKMRTLRFVKE